MNRGTHTFATLELTPAAYDEIRAKLTAAKYFHAFIDRSTVDMHGIGVTRGSENTPIDMILLCPSCGVQHIDEPNAEKNWTNPPHREHECQSCGMRWKPSNHPTNGVTEILEKHRFTSSGQPDTCKCGESVISSEHY